MYSDDDVADDVDTRPAEDVADDKGLEAGVAVRPSNGSEAPMAGSPCSWPRSFEHSMDLYSQAGRRTNRKSRESLSLGSSRDISPTDDSETSFRPWLRQGRHSMKSALTPLLSETNLSQLEQQAADSAELQKDKEGGEEQDRRQLNRVSSADSETIHLGVYESSEFRTGASFAETTVNSVNVLIGVGILSTPYAASQGGWLGLLLLLLFACVFFHTALFLKDCIESRPYITTYPDIGEAAFGKAGRWLIAVLLYFELYSVTVDLMILEGDNLAQIFPHVKLDLGWLVLPPEQLMLLLTAVCILPSVWMRDLSFLAYVSICGVLASVLVAVAVGWVGVAEGVGFSSKGTLFRWNGLPVAVGVYSFCFSGHTVLPNIYCSMKHPAQFSQVLAVAFAFSTVLYAGVAVMGYAMYGDDVQSQITLNMPPDAVVSKIATWTTVINPLTKFALMVTPLAMAIEELFPWGPRDRATVICSVVVRTLLVFCIALVALSLPFFGFVMAFIGSCLGVTMSVILPCLCYLRLVGGGVWSWKVVACICYIILGVISAGVGTYSSISSILASLVPPLGEANASTSTS